jgi:hypothetical protein
MHPSTRRSAAALALDPSSVRAQGSEERMEIDLI